MADKSNYLPFLRLILTMIVSICQRLPLRNHDILSPLTFRFTPPLPPPQTIPQP